MTILHANFDNLLKSEASAQAICCNIGHNFETWMLLRMAVMSEKKAWHLCNIFYCIGGGKSPSSDQAVLDIVLTD